MRQLRECSSPLATAYFGRRNQALLQRTLADRVADATGVRLGEQDLLTCMVRAYRAAPHTSTDTDADVPAINRILLGAVAPYVIRSVKIAGYHAARVDAGVTKSTAPPSIAPEALSSSYDSFLPQTRMDPPLMNSMYSAPVGMLASSDGAPL